MGICYCPLGPKASVPGTTNIFFWLMLRAQIGQCAVFKTPTKLQHPYCNIFEAIAIGKLDLVMDRRNVSLFRDLATEPIFTLRISQPLNIFFVLRTFSSIRSISSISTSCMVLLKVKSRQRFYRGIDMLWGSRAFYYSESCFSLKVTVIQAFPQHRQFLL